MHDPMTVAFEIKYPWRKYPKGDKFWPDGYRETFITVWHVDPERNSYARGLRGDDSCGWFTPPTTQEDRDAIRALGEAQWSTLFQRRWRAATHREYVEYGFEPTPFEAVYWAWRAIKFRGGRGWQYGDRRLAISRREEESIRLLASNPVDNIQHTVEHMSSAEQCGEFFGIVWRQMLRLNRPWYRHPRWHMYHWQLQIHPLQAFKRWAFTRCTECGRGFAWGESGVGGWHSTGPRWFRSEDLRHCNCDRTIRDQPARAV